MSRYNHYDSTQNVYEYCKKYFEFHGYAPSMKEICEGTGLKSKASVHAHMQKLFDEGAFESEHPGHPRAFRIAK